MQLGVENSNTNSIASRTRSKAGKAAGRGAGTAAATAAAAAKAPSHQKLAVKIRVAHAEAAAADHTALQPKRAAEAASSTPLPSAPLAPPTEGRDKAAEEGPYETPEEAAEREELAVRAAQALHIMQEEACMG